MWFGETGKDSRGSGHDLFQYATSVLTWTGSRKTTEIPSSSWYPDRDSKELSVEYKLGSLAVRQVYVTNTVIYEYSRD